eukprot:517049_1
MGNKPYSPIDKHETDPETSISEDELDLEAPEPQDAKTQVSEEEINKNISRGTCLQVMCCTIYGVYIICILAAIAMLIFAVMSDISLSVLLGFVITLIITYIGSIFGIFAAWKTKTIKEITKDLETNNEALKQQNE